MLLSKNWLRDYVFLPDALDAKELAERLCLSTVEVEKVINQAAAFEHMVVGQIKKIEAHPNADKLKVCTVDVGNENLTIVCGGSNIKEGQKVAVAKVGASVRWHGEGEPIAMEKTAIRGVESAGMICASDEIGLAERFPKKEEKEILDLSELKIKVGQPLAQALGLDDIIFDIDNKSMTNRPDLWGHYGMAREIAALTRKKFKILAPPQIKPGKELKINVQVKAPELCPRYMAVAVSGLASTPSPEWLARRLETAGLRSINAIVDLTNYVMLELGQPLHAFDAEELFKKSITVRRAHNNEKFTTLDDKQLTLHTNILVIADDEKALAIAGVKGGQNSGVTERTNTVVFEAATFEAGSIRRTSNALGLRTDSSARFEKSLDPHLPELALQRVVELAKKIFPASRVVSNVVDVRQFSAKPIVLNLAIGFINDRLGLVLDHKAIVDILERLGFGVKTKKDTLTVTVPTWRATKDITIPEDIVEEVARVYGYAKIPAALPRFTINTPEINTMREFEREIKEALAFEAGMTEIYNYSFVAPEWLTRLGVGGENYLALDNPIAKDRPWLRRDLLPGLIENINKNVYWAEHVRLFEIGRVYRAEESGERAKPNSNELLPAQPIRLGMAVAEKDNHTPFFLAAHALRLVSERLGLGLTLHNPETVNALFHPGRQAAIVAGEKTIGVIGELHSRLQQGLGIMPRVALAELTLSELVTLPRASAMYKPVPEFPSAERDIAFVVDRRVAHSDIQTAIRAVDPMITGVTLFDVFEGKNIGPGKKSMAYHLSYQAPDRTLTAENADAIHAKVTAILKKQFKADLRE